MEGTKTYVQGTSYGDDDGDSDGGDGNKVARSGAASSCWLGRMDEAATEGRADCGGRERANCALAPCQAIRHNHCTYQWQGHPYVPLIYD